MKVLLSIKPEFVEKIFNGNKKYEFRRVIFKNSQVKKILIYASHPVQKLVGEFEIDEIINSEIKNLWDVTSEKSGISKDYFFQYFNEKSHGYAIKIKNPKKYKVPKCIKAEYNIHPPQSFIYIV